MLAVDEDRKTIVHWRVNRGHLNSSVFQMISNETWGVVRTTVNSDGYQSQSHVAVEKWTDQAGFKLVVRYALSDFTEITHYSPNESERRDAFERAAMDALRGLRKVMQ